MNYSDKLNNLIPGGSYTYSIGDDQYLENAPQILVKGKVYDIIVYLKHTLTFTTSDDISINRQDLYDVWFFNGSLYLSYVDSFKKHREFYDERTIGIEFEDYKKIEIDSLFDFEIAKTIFDEKNK